MPLGTFREFVGKRSIRRSDDTGNRAGWLAAVRHPGMERITNGVEDLRRATGGLFMTALAVDPAIRADRDGLAVERVQLRHALDASGGHLLPESFRERAVLGAGGSAGDGWGRCGHRDDPSRKRENCFMLRVSRRA